MKKLHIKKLVRTLLIVSLLFITLFSCVDHNLKDDPVSPDASESVTQKKLIIELPLTLGTIADTRGTTNEDGSSSEGQYRAYRNENIMKGGFYLFVQAWEETSGEGGKYVNKFTVHYANDLDFNGLEDVHQDHILVPLTLTPSQLKAVAGNEKVRFFIISNITDNALKYKIRVGDDNHSANFLNGGFDPDAYLINLYPGRDQEWGWMGLFEPNGSYVPFVSKDENLVSFAGITEEDVDEYIRDMESNSAEDSEVLSKIQNVLKDLLKYEDLNGQQKISPLKLERAVARVDFSDGSPWPEKPGFYPLIEDEENEVFFYGKLTRIDPISVHKRTYIFRHTSPGDTDGIFYDNGYTVNLFGEENGDNPEIYNWIIDPDAEFKKEQSENWTFGYPEPQIQDYFFQSLKVGDHTSITSNSWCTDLLPYTGTEPFDGNENNWECIAEKGHKYHLFHDNYVDRYLVENTGKIYYPWRYLPENVLPSQKAMIRGLSSGLRFEVALYDKDFKELTLENTQAMIDRWNEKRAKDPTFPYFAELYYSSTFHENTLRIRIGEDEIDEVILVTETSPNSSKSLYKLYYTYYFRHNALNDADHRLEGMPMKFGIVRNNIYRLSISGFNGLPRAYEPTDPDEPEEEYGIKVNCDILPWGIRSDEEIVLE